jgi:type I restriction enzyme S subunit
MSVSTDRLPDGWAWAKLSELGSWVGGGTPSKAVPEYWDGGTVPWVSPKDMKLLRVQDTEDHITLAAVEKSAAQLFPANSIAVVVRSGILSRTLPIALIAVAATANQDMRVLVPDDSLNSNWVLWALTAAAEDIRRKCQKDGTTVASIDVPAMQNYAIPVPPRREQDRIVSVLESTLGKLADGERAFAEAAAGCESLRMSLLAELATPQFPRVTIGDVGQVFGGATPSRKDPGLWGGGIPWVSSGEVAFCRIDSTRETITERGLGNAATRLHPPGTVLLAMIGEGKTRGQAAILDVAAAHNQNCASIRLEADRMVPEFLFYCLMGQYEQNREAGRGGQQPALNGSLVRALEVPCPALDVQRQLVAELQTRLAQVELMSANLHARLDASRSLRESLLFTALTGQLVTQCTQDEPASAMLSRIAGQPPRLRARARRPAVLIGD